MGAGGGAPVGRRLVSPQHPVLVFDVAPEAIPEADHRPISTAREHGPASHRARPACIDLLQARKIHGASSWGQALARRPNVMPEVMPRVTPKVMPRAAASIRPNFRTVAIAFVVMRAPSGVEGEA